MKKKRKSEDEIGARIKLILLFFFLALTALAARLFVLQIVNHRTYAKAAAGQHQTVQAADPERGGIYAQDRNGALIPLALNKVYKNLIASPKLIADPDDAAGVVADFFGVDREMIRRKLGNPEDGYEILLKRVDTDRAEEFTKKNIAGLSFEEERRRIYPHGTRAAQAVGFVSKESNEEVGRYGIERFSDVDLKGERGVAEGTQNSGGFLVALGRRILHPQKNGSDVVLTIDDNVEMKSEEVLRAAKEKWSADSGGVLVLEPATGRILAMAGDPSFDPNDFGKEKDLSVFLNPLTQSVYELGSVLKPLTMAGALDANIITPASTYTDTGEVKIGGYRIKNFDGNAYGLQTMTQVLEKSLNTGMVHIARMMGHDQQKDILERFGLGTPAGVDTPGEVAGNIANLNAGRDIDFATAAFGQGISVTPMQLAAAVGVIANGGKLMRPYVIDRIIDDAGNETKKTPVVIREVIRKETAETLTKMLVSVVHNGFENHAGVKGYFVAGKTGTAQIPNPASRGYSDKVTHTFVGYAPAFHPKFLVLLQLNNPKGNRFAANTLTPAFHDLAEYMLNYYEIPPDEK
ncbi:MAG: penicillin-binding protein 2 [bacterium]|nr:penicillin-binding protein 2 [bacterium]MDZ4299858.1 penicillin-binding protein 2 [Candidatus Sungbacteria bacterium]